MEESVGGLDGVLAREIVRRVAVVARGNGMVTALDPGSVVIAHDMAVRTGFRIVGEVGVSLGVNEGIEAEADKEAEENAERDSCGDRSHVATLWRDICTIFGPTWNRKRRRNSGVREGFNHQWM